VLNDETKSLHVNTKLEERVLATPTMQQATVTMAQRSGPICVNCFYSNKK